ncbi:hypothetical protein SMICM304S_03933 [Streptomyces microflavus]
MTLTVALLAVLHAGIAYAIVGFGFGRGPALGVAAGVLVVGYLLHGIAPMSDALEPLANVSPWEWALGSDPLLNGVPWGGVALLVAVSVVVVAARDVRRGPTRHQERLNRAPARSPAARCLPRGGAGPPACTGWGRVGYGVDARGRKSSTGSHRIKRA